MGSIMGPIGLEQLEVFALELGKIAAFDCFLSSIYKYKPIGTKLGHNISKYKTSDEFDYRSSHTRSVLSVLEIEKLNFSSLFGIYLHY